MSNIIIKGLNAFNQLITQGFSSFTGNDFVVVEEISAEYVINFEITTEGGI